MTGYAVERWGNHSPMVGSKKRPGICTMVSQVCHDRGLPIGERRVLQIYKLFSRFMPVHQDWLQLKKGRSA